MKKDKKTRDVTLAKSTKHILNLVNYFLKSLWLDERIEKKNTHKIV